MKLYFEKGKQEGRKRNSSGKKTGSIQDKPAPGSFCFKPVTLIFITMRRLFLLPQLTQIHFCSTPEKPFHKVFSIPGPQVLLLHKTNIPKANYSLIRI